MNRQQLIKSDIWLYHGVKYIVSWNPDKAKFYFRHPNAFAGDDDHIELGWSTHGEKIGNIHDNPELLEAE
ncbi:hypothetical protein [Paenibacillus sp. GXUN7292]|uniref:hypothetical protein n=1 Tax=Paenibacillus sp. GXUN7292 TaxID=3422499 RepID=UPI003D7D5059